MRNSFLTLFLGIAPIAHAGNTSSGGGPRPKGMVILDDDSHGGEEIADGLKLPINKIS